MDYRRVNRELVLQKERLQRAIDELEKLNAAPAVRGRRGRKSMGAEERKQVSERMHKYWATRRAKKG